MPDTMERELAARLRNVAATVPNELDPPADLELQVARRRKRTRRVVGLSSLAVAASLVAAVAIVAVVQRAPANQRVGVSTPGAAAMSLLEKTVLLDARGQWAAGLDANGHQLITLATSHSGTVVQAQLARDHKTLWYLSVAGRAGVDCGNLVRADIATGNSWIVTRAVAFGISPDSTRLALSGRGDCAPGGAPLAVRDLGTGVSVPAHSSDVPTLITWSPAGDRIVTVACSGTCGPVHAFDVPAKLGGSLRGRDVYAKGFAAYGTDGLYVVSGRDIVRLDLATLRTRTTVVAGVAADPVEVVPTRRGMYVVMRPQADAPAGVLSRIDAGRLVPVRTFADGFGALSPVWQPR